MGNAMRILLVEDHADLSDMVSDHLAGAGFAVDVAASVEQALHAMRIVDYDLLVLDLGLPDGDGMEVLAFTRRDRRRRNMPVLILTARDDMESRINGLNAGGDDYLVKPFSLPELVARIRAVLRRPGARESRVIEYGDVEFDIPGCTAHAGGRLLELAKKEFALLEELIRAAPGIVIKDRLEDRLYAFHEPVTPNAIEAIVSRLRKKIASNHAQVRIETVRGLGYRMMSGRDPNDA